MSSSSKLLSILTGAVLVASQAAVAAEPVGQIERVVLFAYGTLPSQTRQPAYLYDKVYFGEKLETVENGSLKVGFIDHTDLYLGSKSSLVIDSYVFDPKQGKEALAIKMSSGAFRFVTGKIAKAAVTVKTPVASIGIRGTDFSVGVAEGGQSVIAVDSGTVAISTAASPAPTIANAGDVVTVNVDGSVAVGTVSAAPNDIGLTNSGAVDGGVSSDGGGGGSASSSSY